jgi:hypothetical protein
VDSDAGRLKAREPLRDADPSAETPDREMKRQTAVSTFDERQLPPESEAPIDVYERPAQAVSSLASTPARSSRRQFRRTFGGHGRSRPTTPRRRTCGRRRPDNRVNTTRYRFRTDSARAWLARLCTSRWNRTVGTTSAGVRRRNASCARSDHQSRRYAGPTACCRAIVSIDETPTTVVIHELVDGLSQP